MVYIKLAKKGQPRYHLDNQTKFSHTKEGPFEIEQVISPLRYRVKLPPWFRWHLDISVEHLEPVRPDPFNRPCQPPGPLTQGNDEKFIIEAVTHHERRNDKLYSRSNGLDTQNHRGMRQLESSRTSHSLFANTTLLSRENNNPHKSPVAM